MQKLLSIILALAMYFAFGAVSGPVESDADWFEVTENTVLTISLPAIPSTGYEWSFDISDPEVLELITMEYVADVHSEDMTGSGGTWVASFRGLKEGTATLLLTKAASYDETSIADQRKLEINVDDDLSLMVWDVDNGAELLWFELSEDETVITVRLPANETTGYAWGFASEPEIMEHITEEYLPDEGEDMMVGQGGTWVASFRAIPGMSGETQLILSYQRAWETDPIEVRTLVLTVDDDGTLEIAGVALDK